jgi:beta-lactam-binding protein with PASTA domain
MSIFKSGLNAIGRLLIVAALAVAFFFGLVGVVYMSLQGHVIQVPDVTGKSFAESEKELSDLGLKIQRRADRVSNDPPNTVLEQLPHPGETVKTGQMIFVVASKQGPVTETPSTLKKSTEEDDTEKIEEMISDKPKKKSASNSNANANANTNKKLPDTTRDTIGNVATSNTSTTGTDNSNKKETTPGNNGEKENKNPSTPEKLPANKVILIKPTGPDPRPKTPGKPNK